MLQWVRKVGTKLPLEGNFKDSKTNTPDAIFEVLRNAFFQALITNVENEINIHSVEESDKKDDRNFLQGVFSNKIRGKTRRTKSKIKGTKKRTTKSKRYKPFIDAT